jgi:hypothetical protein
MKVRGRVDEDRDGAVAVLDQVQSALHAGEDAAVLECNVGVLHRALGGTRAGHPTRARRRHQVRQAGSHEAVRSDDTEHDGRAAVLCRHFLQRDVDIGVVVFFEALGHDRQGVRLHAEMQAQMSEEDGLLGRPLRGDLVEKVLERSAEISRCEIHGVTSSMRSGSVRVGQDKLGTGSARPALDLSLW